MTVTILHGDALTVLRTLDAESVQCVVTSPPYWGLRDYNVPPTIWGGDPTCKHEWVTGTVRRKHYDKGTSTLGGPNRMQMEQGTFEVGYGTCRHCGAWRCCLGLEPMPELYVEHLVAVFREVRRVLRKDGTVWLNLGDCYASGNRGPNEGHTGNVSVRLGKEGYAHQANRNLPPDSNLKPKDLVGIPWRVAFALQADGWWLRSDIIWHKPNSMPENVRDRCTRSHEYVFMLAKSARYFYDYEAVKEPSRSRSRARTIQDGESMANTKVRGRNGSRSTGDTRNRRDVWTINTKPYSGAHFAVMPPDLAEICIKAGTSEKGCCPKCGEPWERVTKRLDKRHWTERRSKRNKWALGAAPGGRNDGGGSFEGDDSVTIGWEPTCSCDMGGPVPCTVLDPFGGAGTTGLVADRLGRDAILIELNPEYCELARQRIRADAGMWAAVD